MKLSLMKLSVAKFSAAKISPRAPRLRSLTGAISAAVVAGMIILPVTAEAAQPNPADFTLTRTDTNPQLLSALTSALPAKKVSDVVASANRTGEACTANASNLAASFCWQSGDNTVPYWIPQGLTSSADASADGKYDGRQVLVAAWYDNGDSGFNRGNRLSFVDMSDPKTPKYRHVLLVEPTGTATQPNFKAVVTHAGGLAWYGNMLYVCDTYGGMRVYDMTKIMAVTSGSDTAIGRQSDGTYQAHNYAFAIPQVAKYTPSTPSGVDALRFSQVSLDRTSSPAALVVSEWSETGDGTRIVRFNLDSSGKVAADTDGKGRGDFAWTVSFTGMQGATSANGTYYVHRNTGGSRSGLLKWTPGSYAEINDNTLPGGVEDVTYWGPTGRLWSQTERVGSRVVFATTLSAW